MSSYKISEKDLQGHIAERINSINIKTYAGLSQINLEAGTETIDSIMEALPDHSVLHLAVTPEHNSSIYPHNVGTCIIEDIYTTGATFRFYAKVNNIPRIWKGLYVNNAFSGWTEVFTVENPPKVEDIEGAVSVEYLDQQLANFSGGSGTGVPKLQVYPLDILIGEEGQTEFDIELSTFDATTDTVIVQRGMLLLNPNSDYTIEGNKLILTEGVAEGQSIGIWVWKNIPMGEEGTVSGKCISERSLPLTALEELPKAEDIGAASIEYVDEQFANFSGGTDTGVPKLQVYPLDLIIAEEGQTEFEIDLSTFDKSTDTVLVQNGRLWLNPNGDYTIEGNIITLTEGVEKDTTIGIWVWKNVPMGEDGSVSGKVIAKGTLPLDALEEMPSVSEDEFIERLTSLDDIDLSDEDFSVDTLEENIYKVLQYMPSYGILSTRGEGTPLFLSIKNRINENCNASISDNTNVSIRLTKFGSTKSPAKLEVMFNDVDNQKIYCTKVTGISNNTTNIDPFIEVYNPAGYLPLNETGGVHNIRTYTSLAQIGLTDDMFSTEDFSSNIALINDMINGGFILNMYIDINNYNNFRISVVKKLATDTGLYTADAPSAFTITLQQSSNKFTTMKIDLVPETNIYQNAIFSCSFNMDGTDSPVYRITPFVFSKHPSGFLPLDGSVPMSGDLKIDKGGGTNTSIQHWSVTSEFRRTYADGTHHGLVISDESWLKYKPIYRVYNGTATECYYLYGEHNKELLTESKKDLPLADGYTTSYGCYYYKNADGEVTVRLHLVASETKTSNTRYTIGILPVGYRPNGFVFVPCINMSTSYSSATTGAIILRSSGEIDVTCSNSWNLIGASFTFKADM